MGLMILPSEWVKGKLIGSGSFGHVYIAMNKNTGHTFVVKSSNFKVGIKSLQNEVEILRKLKNAPYVIQYIGHEITRGLNNECTFNIFMEHMGGGSLFDVMGKFGGKLLEGVIRSYTRQILVGLSYLHENRIVHSDIKCKNILLDSHGNLKLGDFGCASVVDSDSIEEDILSNDVQPKKIMGGTPLWMAPEVLRGGHPSMASDIWSLGCTIIEMATGKPPIWGSDMKNSTAVILKIITSDEKPQFPKDFSEDGLHFLKKCFQRDPSKRSTAEELLQHRFILNNDNNNFNQRLMKFEDTFSPVSVLDVGNFDMTFGDCEDKSEHCDLYDVATSTLGLTSIKHQGVRNDFLASFLEPHTVLDSTESWITVR